MDTALEAEFKARVGDIMQRIGLTWTGQHVDRLCKAITGNVEDFRRSKRDMVGKRQSYDQRRHLLDLLEKPGTTTQQLAVLLSGFPPALRKEIEQRALGISERVLPGAPRPSSLIQWLQTAEFAHAAEILQASLVGGATFVKVKRRGMREAETVLEPMIGGMVRGAGQTEPGQKGGRPAASDEVELVMWLAVAWIRIVGVPPTPGRSSRSPFGELVHLVFDTFELGQATGPLRRYWAELRRGETSLDDDDADPEPTAWTQTICGSPD